MTGWIRQFVIDTKYYDTYTVQSIEYSMVDNIILFEYFTLIDSNAYLESKTFILLNYHLAGVALQFYLYFVHDYVLYCDCGCDCECNLKFWCCMIVRVYLVTALYDLTLNVTVIINVCVHVTIFLQLLLLIVNAFAIALLFLKLFCMFALCFPWSCQ